MLTIPKLNINDPISASKDKIISPDIVVSHRTAETILGKATVEAQSIIESAQNSYNEEMARAYKEGFQKWEEEKTKLTAQFNIEIKNHINQLQDKLTENVIQLTERIIGLQPDNQVLSGLVNQAISQLSTECSMCLRVSPQNAKLAKETIEIILSNNTEIERFEVIVDPKLCDDSFLLEHPEGTHDISLNTQLSNATEMLTTIT